MRRRWAPGLPLGSSMLGWRECARCLHEDHQHAKDEVPHLCARRKQKWRARWLHSGGVQAVRTIRSWSNTNAHLVGLMRFTIATMMMATPTPLAINCVNAQHAITRDSIAQLGWRAHLL